MTVHIWKTDIVRIRTTVGLARCIAWQFATPQKFTESIESRRSLRWRLMAPRAIGAVDQSLSSGRSTQVGRGPPSWLTAPSPAAAILGPAPLPGMTLNTIQSSLAAGRDALLSGDATTAVALLERAAAAAPADVEARYWLASARLTAGDPQAGKAMEDARALHALIQAKSMGADLPRLQREPAYAAAIADQLYARKLVAMSGVVRRLAIDAGATDAPGLLSYALALQHQGRPDEACEIFQLAADRYPTPPVGQFLIYPQLLCTDGDGRHAAAARAWARRHAPPLATLPPPANPPRPGRKLRIGYVAPWFATCQLKQFVAPLLEHHDPDAVAVTLYPNETASEAGCWPDWIDIHPLGGLSDADAAAVIRRDGIDVLADCWGHSAGSRLPVFALRPAPVQVAWINFIQTSGLPQMDYVLHADAETPPGMTELYTEQIWRIGPVFNAFRAAAGRLAPVSTPALARGQVTFGSFNHPAKLSGSALDAWSAVLRGAPTSRLLLKYSYFVDPVLQRVTQARFAARGVAPERIVFAGHSTGEAYFSAFREVDLMLDAWPAPGSTTTLDALSNGVPVLTMAEPSLPGMYARSILEASGMAELVTTSAEQFVDHALWLAADPGRLDEVRSRVRPGFDAGLCCDEAGFTARVEAAFAQMFDAWLSSSVPARAIA
jgi:protein O-GlcNAc transferase